MNTPVSGPRVKNHILSKRAEKIPCNTENYVPIVVPTLSNGSWSSCTALPPTASSSQDSERENCTLRHVKKEVDKERSLARENLSHNRPAWPEEFTENLADGEASTAEGACMSRRIRTAKSENCKSNVQNAPKQPHTSLITADHKVLNEECESRNQSQVRGDRARFGLSMVTGLPVQNKTSQETEQSLQKFLEKRAPSKWCTLTVHRKLGESCEDLSHCTSTPHRSDTLQQKRQYAGCKKEH